MLANRSVCLWLVLLATGCACNDKSGGMSSMVLPACNFNAVKFPNDPGAPTSALSNSIIEVTGANPAAAVAPGATTIPAYRPPRLKIVSGWVYITGLSSNVSMSNGDESVTICGEGCRFVLSNCLNSTGNGGTVSGRWRIYAFSDNAGDEAYVFLNKAAPSVVTVAPGNWVDVVYHANAAGGYEWFYEGATGTFSETPASNSDLANKWLVQQVISARNCRHVDEIPPPS